MMKTIRTLLNRNLLFMLAVAVLLFSVGRTSATTYLSDGHVGVGIGYEANQWDLHIHVHDAGEYEPDETVLVVNVPQSEKERTAGAEWDFLGVPAGETFYRLPAAHTPGLLFLGMSAEELSGVFSSWDPDDPRLTGPAEWIRLNVVDVQGAGSFSLWQEDNGPLVWVASSDGLDSTDAAYILQGGHVHYNWGFSDPGDYRVTMQATANLDGTLITSDPVTYTFAVPEPASLGMLSLIGLTMWRRTRR
jgi:surface-anchored protein